MALSSGEIGLGKLGAGKGAPKRDVSKRILLISNFFFFFFWSSMSPSSNLEFLLVSPYYHTHLLPSGFKNTLHYITG